MVTTIKGSTIKHSIQKARKLDPRFIKVAEGFYAVASESNPEEGYLLEVVDGHIYCECEGYEHQGMCYHRAALALKLGLMPEAWLRIAEDTQENREAEKERREASAGHFSQREPLTSLWQ